MSRDLGCDHVGDQLLARTHHGRRSFITGAFDPKDVSVGHASILVQARRRNVGSHVCRAMVGYRKARMLTTKGQRYDKTGSS